MSHGDIRILSAGEVGALLEGREVEVIRAVQAAYEAHATGASALPHSTFLRFPDHPRNRIIALPAYLGADFEVAGVKWIASFPENRALGLERASAVVIVNSARTGRPEAILEGSLISARRTAASAALAAWHLHSGQRADRAGLIGCGVINMEVARFLLSVFPELERLVVFDASADQARRFKQTCQDRFPEVEVDVARDVASVFGAATLFSIATTALEPHIDDLAACGQGSTILHVSLRDLAPRVILSCDNVVDDPDHVCRAGTSLHLAEQIAHDRAFIRCTLADITRGVAPARADPDRIAVFSPFGLGVLDLAVARLVLDRALAENRGTVMRSFLPESEH